MDASPMLFAALLMGLIWGCLIAASLEFSQIGKRLAAEMMWFVVALGAGGDMLISLMVTDLSTFLVNWIHVALIFFVTSIPIVIRRILEWVREEKKEAEEKKNTLEETVKNIKNGA